MHWILEQLGKDSRDVHVAGRVPAAVGVPRTGPSSGSPARRRPTSPSARSSSSTAATSTACRSTSSRRDGLHILNIDHHHDNTRFGTVNLVVPAGLVHGRDRLATWPRSWAPRSRPRSPTRSTSGWSPTPGKFMYENTTPEAHRMAAELIEAGVEPHEVYRRLYEDLPFRRLQLLQRALSTRRALRRRRDHDLAISSRTTSSETGAPRPTPRASSTTCARSRAPPWRCSCASCSPTTATGMRKVSLRATDGRVDVSRIARELGGGGHRQAAGFTTELPYRRARRARCAQQRRATSSDRAGVLLDAKPAG